MTKLGLFWGFKFEYSEIGVWFWILHQPDVCLVSNVVLKARAERCISWLIYWISQAHNINVVRPHHVVWTHVVAPPCPKSVLWIFYYTYLFVSNTKSLQASRRMQPYTPFFDRQVWAPYAGAVFGCVLAVGVPVKYVLLFGISHWFHCY